jgi:acyl-coenzyme A thioesterase PaaI-like protein
LLQSQSLNEGALRRDFRTRRAGERYRLPPASDHSEGEIPPAMTRSSARPVSQEKWETRRYHQARRAHSGCIACGDREQNPLSLALDFDRQSDGSISAVCCLDRTHQGYPGMLHGGIVGMLLDAAMTHCLFSRGISAFTAEMVVRYVAPAPIGQSLLLVARLIASKRRTFRLEARLTENHKLLARAEAKFIDPFRSSQPERQQISAAAE